MNISELLATAGKEAGGAKGKNIVNVVGQVSPEVAAKLAKQLKKLKKLGRGLVGARRKKASEAAKKLGELARSKFVIFNKTHKGSAPKPKGVGPNGGNLQSHHGLQQEWAVKNLSQHGYDPKLAPTVTIETGKGLPHTKITNAQNLRRDTRVAAGNGKWSSSLQEELQHTVNDFKKAGFSKETIEKVMEQQYKMLDKLGVSYERIGLR